jgi:NADPH-dependent 2,4-dienoyl-CoA reductase/sulfur reductase-like enzyme
MKKYRYLIVGGGMAADAAVAGIREVDEGSPIGILSAEAHPPYDRPPLSKGLWKGEDPQSVWRRGVLGRAIDLHLSRLAVELDAGSQQVRDNQGETYSYERLLLATGGTPRRLPFGEGSIIYFRTVDDFWKLKQLADSRDRFVVIGGGFIGSEIAAALAMNGRKVTLIFPGQGIGERVFGGEMAVFMNAYFRERGVEVLPGDAAVDAQPTAGVLRVKTKKGEIREGAGVVAGLGISPNVELAEQAGLETQDGIVVDEYLRTTRRAQIFAAGDVARFPSAALEGSSRVEHEDAALSMGKLAGQNMAGRAKPNLHIPMFYSDLFEFAYEAVGRADSRLEMVADWIEPFRRGVVYYLENRKVRGVLLVNTPGQVEKARRLIVENELFQATELKGRISSAA